MSTGQVKQLVHIPNESGLEKFSEIVALISFSCMIKNCGLTIGSSLSAIASELVLNELLTRIKERFQRDIESMVKYFLFQFLLGTQSFILLK